MIATRLSNAIRLRNSTHPFIVELAKCGVGDGGVMVMIAVGFDNFDRLLEVTT